MPRTFCSTPATFPVRHSVKTGHGTYVMSAFWIDVTAPSDMMDYDFTAPIHELKAMHETIRLNNIT